MALQDGSDAVVADGPTLRNDKPKSQRLISLDAYRGAIMVMMASGGLGLAHVARQYPDSRLWQSIAYHTEHAEWVGFTVWDVIQPAFMFMVGVAMAFSVANRRARGQGVVRLFAHALWRAVALVLLAVFLSSAWSRQTQWVFANVLAQIGLGYLVVFGLAFARPRTQWIVAIIILFLTWLAFALYPLSAVDFDWAQCRRAGRLGAPDGLCRPLGEEHQHRRGFRPLVPEPLSARRTVPLQSRRIHDTELRPFDCHDDLWFAGRSTAAQ